MKFVLAFFWFKHYCLQSLLYVHSRQVGYTSKHKPYVLIPETRERPWNCGSIQLELTQTQLPLGHRQRNSS